MSIGNSVFPFVFNYFTVCLICLPSYTPRASSPLVDRDSFSLEGLAYMLINSNISRQGEESFPTDDAHLSVEQGVGCNQD